jgi:hypothetical protein
MTFTSVAAHLLYWPLCRCYAKWVVGDRPADPLLTRLSTLQYRAVHEAWPKLEHPERFSEKLWCRMLWARDPRLTLLSDKLRVREFVAQRIGPEYLVPLLWTGQDPSDIPFDRLPARFVIQANHGCGYNVIVSDKSRLDRRRLSRQLARWLRTNYCEETYLGIEWGYRNVKPALLIKEFLGQDDTPPVDFKCWCFSGTVEFATLHFDRFANHRYLAVDRAFGGYDVRLNFVPWEGGSSPPSNFDAMVTLAERLAAEYAFMRVDLYSVGDRIYFGECSPYPGGTSFPIRPRDRDLHLGSLWRGDPRDLLAPAP